MEKMGQQKRERDFKKKRTGTSLLLFFPTLMPKFMLTSPEPCGVVIITLF